MADPGTVRRRGGLPPLPSQPADISGECWRGNHDGCEGYTDQQNNDPTDIDSCLCECHDEMEARIRAE